MEKRKIQLVGKRSYAISLPKEWVLRQHLKEQDILTIEVTGNDDLLVHPGKAKLPSRELRVRAEEAQPLSEFLVFCFMKGFDKVVLRLDNDTVLRTKVRETLKYLEGFDITAEDEHNVEITALFTDYSVTVPQTIRRMTYLLKHLLEGVRRKEARAIEETEMAIDRLYHLTTRLLFACMRDVELRRRNALHNEEDAVFYKDIARHLENIGDVICGIERASAEDYDCMATLLDGLTGVFDAKLTVEQLQQKIAALRIDAQKMHVSRVAALCHDITETLLSLRFNAKF